MTKELYPYYERELRDLRKYAREFARQYPATASRLMLDSNRSPDPHVERLIESVALLVGRVRRKLDDEFPELTDALLNILYPHYLAPVPSMSIIEFVLDSAGAQMPDGFQIAAKSRLHSQPVGELPCTFRTCYPVMLWPISVSEASYMAPPFPSGLRAPHQTAAALRLQLSALADLNFSDMSLDSLRFYLHGDNQLITRLYEQILNQTLQVVFRPRGASTNEKLIVAEPEDVLAPVGFELDEGMLPYSNQSFLGYRLLTEFFTFPNKFLFFELKGFDKIREAGYQRGLEVVFFLNQYRESLEHAIDAHNFRLGCTPIVNLFEQVTEPILLDQAHHEYQVVPNIAHSRGMEVYSIDSVVSTDPAIDRVVDYHPFYSFRHEQGADRPDAFWYASRRPSPLQDDRGTDVFLHLVDLNFSPRVPAKSVLTVKTTCTNRDLPIQLQLAGERLRFTLEASAPLSHIRCLKPTTTPLRPPLRRGAHWRLISHLSMNHLSLHNSEEGCEALREILRLYDFSDPEIGQQLGAVTHQMIEGINSVSSRRVVAQIGSPTSSGFCRGMEVTLEFDEEKYVGTGVFLFASVLERFLGLYASLNSFVQTVARTKQGEGALKQWKPRAGDRPLL
ncbi:hypothetical protein Pan216_43000 [Planctomycetes bacterium Pan216]|uniref:Type VI secretion system baseplate subunit TssF n=1 Tax=Kolteria novifilia TaxID=2527975 RepID=A0A518B8X4_9BACT|nr:hypothetical protein Pan216_43000 [Planctomycetes bacterium Pan216]